MESKPRSMRYEIAKTYPPRGPLHQYRLSASTSFDCFRCGRTKKSKLITAFRDQWDHLLCNGCYGRLLSLHDVKRDNEDTAAVADALAEELLGLLSSDEHRRAQDLLRVKESRVEVLDPRSLRLLATADFVAGHLVGATGLDWSAAVIGVCKTVELETVRRVVDPIAAAVSRVDITVDVADKDLGRVATYCVGRSSKPPELGAISHFLLTAIHSKERQASSPILSALREVVRRWPHGDWVLDRNGAPAALREITTAYRNPAAHTEELSEGDYRRCADFVLGDAGVLWTLVGATTPG